MAELKLDIDTEFGKIDVETDAAPSTDYVHLASLDIGSEYTVVTEPKEDDKRKMSPLPEEGDTEGQADYDIETGVESLNLDKCFHPQPGDEDTNDFQSINTDEDTDYVQSVYTDEVESRKPTDEIAALLQQDGDGDTLLHTAIILLNYDLAITLIQSARCIQCMLHIQNKLGQTPLHLAVLNSHAHFIRQLIEAGASTSYRDQFLRTPMHIACERNNTFMVEILCEKPRSELYSLNGDLFTETSIVLDPLCEKYCENCVAGAPESRLLDPATHPLNLPNTDGEGCLHLAVRHNNIEIARTLIENGADVNLPDRRSGRTPLHVAADLGHADMTRFLTSVENIDINQKTYNAETALKIAYMRGRENIVALLKP